METKSPLETMSGNEIAFKLTPKEIMPEICKSYLSTSPKDTKSYIAEQIEKYHPTRPRAKSLSGMKEEKVAQLMADIVDKLPEQIIPGMYLKFIVQNRLPLISAFHSSLNVKGHPNTLQGLEEVTANAMKKISKKKMKSIWETLSKKYPTEDISILFANEYMRQPHDMEQLKPYIEQFLKQNPNEHKNGQSPLRVRFNALKHRLYWYWERLQYEHDKIEDGLIMPPQYIIQEGRDIRNEYSSIMATIKAEDPTWDTLADDIDQSQDFESLQRAVELTEKIAPVLKQYRQELDTAIGALQKLTRITTSEESQPLPILKFRREAQKLLSTLTDPATLSNQLSLTQAVATAQLINNKKHPLSAILELIENDNLELARYDELKTTALKHHSQEMAMAAMRGKLKIEKEGEPLRRPKPHHEEIQIIKQQPPADTKAQPEEPACQTQSTTHPAIKKPEREFYDALSKSSPSRLAMEILAGASDNPLLNMKVIALHYLSAGSLREAWAFSERIEKDACSDKTFVLPSVLLKSLSIAPYINETDSTAAEIYQITATDINISAYMVEKQFPWNQALAILTAASLMVPALTAPSLGVMEHHAAHVIKGCPGLSDLFTAIREASMRYVAFTPDNVAQALKWRDANLQHQAIVREASEWYSKSLSARLKYAPARELWSLWMGKKGFVGSIITKAANDEREEASETASIAELLADDQIVSQEITQVARKIFAKRANAEIDGTAKQVITAMVQEAASITMRWAGSVKSLKKSRPPAYIEQMLKDIKALQAAIGPARESVRALLKDTTAEPTKTAVSHCLNAIDGIGNVISGNQPPKPKDGIQITWDTITSANGSLESLLEHLADHENATQPTKTQG